MNILQWIVNLWRWFLSGEIQPQPQPVPPAPIPPPAPVPDNTAEELIIALVNNERAKKGLAALVKDGRITTAARNYARLMAQKNTLSHTLDGDIGSRLSGAGYEWSYAGENIGWNYASPEEMVLGWMQSSGHRANILNSRYVHTGVGIQDDGRGPYYCQDFGTPLN